MQVAAKHTASSGDVCMAMRDASTTKCASCESNTPGLSSSDSVSVTTPAARSASALSSETQSCPKTGSSISGAILQRFTALEGGLTVSPSRQLCFTPSNTECPATTPSSASSSYQSQGCEPTCLLLPAGSNEGDESDQTTVEVPVGAGNTVDGSSESVALVDLPATAKEQPEAIVQSISAIAKSCQSFTDTPSHEGEVSHAVTNREDGHTIQVLPSFGSLAIACRIWSNSCLML